MNIILDKWIGGDSMLKRMAKVLTGLFVFTVLFASLQVSAELPLRVVVNGDKVNFPDAQPFIDENGRTQVPVRFVSEALGANVEWDGTTKKVSVNLNSRKVILTIGKKEYVVNNQSYQMDTVALLMESRTFVPLRFVSEALGATVIWEQNTRSVYIKFDPNASPAPIPTPTATPQAGTVKYYDGIAFNNVNDVDKFGRITPQKSKEFVLKLASQLSFIKENGKYYIKCDYPEIPEAYEWVLTILIFDKDGTHIGYTPGTRFKGADIPSTGSFKKEVTLLNVDTIDTFNIAIYIENSEKDYTGYFNIVYDEDDSDFRAKYFQEIGNDYSEDFSKTFDFNKMFQW
jgi:hypothetical protein